MRKYKRAIAIQGKNTRLAIVPYVRAICGNTENIAFIATKQYNNGQCIGRNCDDLFEVMQMVEEIILESVEED